MFLNLSLIKKTSSALSEVEGCLRSGILFILLFPLAASSQNRITNCNGFPINNTIKINFTISAGASCSGYQIFKGADSISFTMAYDYAGVCGNTTSDENFSWTDYSPNLNAVNYYKVFVPPSDYSQILKVYVEQAPPTPRLIVYPLPADDLVNILIDNEDNKYYDLFVYNSFGTQKLISKGTYSGPIQLKINSLNTGIYVFLFIDADGKVFKGKIYKN